jgi:hypothetical protein
MFFEKQVFDELSLHLAPEHMAAQRAIISTLSRGRLLPKAWVFTSCLISSSGRTRDCQSLTSGVAAE